MASISAPCWSTADEDEVLSQLRHLQLTCRITQRSEYALGNGASSAVFRGCCKVTGRGEKDVAMKRMRFHMRDRDVKRVSSSLIRLRHLITHGVTQMFDQEIYVWSKLRHENVLELLGYSTCEDTGYPLLISEWMQNGTAWSYVRNNPQLKSSDLKALVSTSCPSSEHCLAAKIIVIDHRHNKRSLLLARK